MKNESASTWNGRTRKNTKLKRSKDICLASWVISHLLGALLQATTFGGGTLLKNGSSPVPCFWPYSIITLWKLQVAESFCRLWLGICYEENLSASDQKDTLAGFVNRADNFTNLHLEINTFERREVAHGRFVTLDHISKLDEGIILVRVIYFLVVLFLLKGKVHIILPPRFYTHRFTWWLEEARKWERVYTRSHFRASSSHHVNLWV